MGINIEIKGAHVKDLIDFYLERQRIIRNEIRILENDLKEISAVLMQLRQTRELRDSVDMVKDNELYNSKWQWVKKINFAIRQANGGPLTTNQIVDLLAEYEPDFIENRKRAIASVSSTLSVKTGEEYEKTESETGENAYLIIGDKFKKDNNATDLFGTNITLNDDELPF